MSWPVPEAVVAKLLDLARIVESKDPPPPPARTASGEVARDT